MAVPFRVALSGDFRKPDGSSLVWDIPTNLHAGDNTITLTPTNAEIIH